MSEDAVVLPPKKHGKVSYKVGRNKGIASVTVECTNIGSWVVYAAFPGDVKGSVVCEIKADHGGDTVTVEKNDYVRVVPRDDWRRGVDPLI